MTNNKDSGGAFVLHAAIHDTDLSVDNRWALLSIYAEADRG